MKLMLIFAGALAVGLAHRPATARQLVTVENHAFPGRFYHASMSGSTLMLGRGLYEVDVFEHTATGWELQQVLSSTVNQDYFGVRLALSGDLVAIGARKDDENTGAVYVYERSDGFWSEAAKLVADDAEPGQFFGVSVEVDEDEQTVFAAKHFIRGVYVFEDTGNGWEQTDMLRGADGMDRALGWSMDVSGDTLIAGAPNSDTPVADWAGAAYVFVRAGGSWVEQARLWADDGTEDSAYGKFVACSGDTIAVSAWAENTIGAVYVYERTDGQWSQTQKLVPAMGNWDDRFGHSIDLEGDRMVIGAYNDDDGCASGGISCQSGTVYVFEREGGVWLEKTKLLVDAPELSQAFGSGVALEGGSVVGVCYWDVGEFGAYEFRVLDPNGTNNCVGAPNTVGAGGRILFSGSTEVAENDATLAALDCPPSVLGLFYFGHGHVQVPIGEGFRCVGAPITRIYPANRTDDHGSAVRVVDLSLDPVAGSVLPGTQLNFQYWYRDVEGGAAGFNLTDAVEVSWQ